VISRRVWEVYLEDPLGTSVSFNVTGLQIMLPDSDKKGAEVGVAWFLRLALWLEELLILEKRVSGM